MINQSGPKQPSQEPRILLGKRQRNLLADSIHVEDELMPAFVQPMIRVTILLVVAFFVWAGLTQISEVARAPGEIIPAGQSQLVQHLDGGVVKAILIEEHSHVQAGQILLQIDGTEAKAELNRMQARLAALRLRSERLSAFAENRKPDFTSVASDYDDLREDQKTIYLTQLAARSSTLAILDKQIEERRQRLAQHKLALSAALKQQSLTSEMAKMREDLAERKLVKRTVLLETLRAKVTADSEVSRIKKDIDVAEQELGEVEHRRTDTLNQLRERALNEMGSVRAEIAEVDEAIGNLNAKVERLDITAPKQGYVQDLKVLTVGQVILPGELLMQIVPDNVGLEAEVRIRPKDVGYVRVGQTVNMRVSSFDYARYGFVSGKLKRVSASSIVGNTNEPYYRAWATLDQDYVGKTPGQNLLQPGMQVDAEIVTGEKSLLTYLYKPVINIATRSFKER